ncbi:MAG: PTS sugar transporter subunit IIA [Haemophilus parainfluenzae]|jgi:PTS IIA-like nitrogen-regulatory protein ptsN|nr:MAG: PTS sugar transporter subunit IIA [Haemophilus parainfluenzae]
MGLLSSLLPAENVLLDLEVNSKKRLFEIVAALLEKNQGMDKGQVFQRLLQRERLGSTGLGWGVAIPHGRIPQLREAAVAFVRLKEAIDFQSQDNKPVDLLVFVVVSEEVDNGPYLKLLSQLAQKFSEKEVREALYRALDAESIIHLLDSE